jgi:hypothetical protein
VKIVKKYIDTETTITENMVKFDQNGSWHAIFTMFTAEYFSWDIVP